MERSATIDRLAMRARPEGSPVMHQNWENLLFMHWPIDPELLRPHLPRQLEIDVFEGNGWIGVTPFTVSGLHLTSLPPVPGLSSFHELNVRTYVLHRGVPGIWFFSLDSSKLIPAIAARLFFMAPYFKADIEFLQTVHDFYFRLERASDARAHFEARWTGGIELRAPDAESLAFFLVERYCFFSIRDEKVYSTRVYHHPWILEEASLLAHESGMLSAGGLPEPPGLPLLHFSRNIGVDIWPPRLEES